MDDRPAEGQTARKSVSFSLRARGPGPAYNSPSPEQQPHPPAQPADAHPAQQGTPSGATCDANVDVVRRLFRAVQGHASSPEPQPNAYPGRVPQPQQARAAATVPEPRSSDPGSGHPRRHTWAGEWQAGPPGGGDEAGSLDARALDRVRLALSCVTRAGAAFGPPPYHPGFTVPTAGGGHHGRLAPAGDARSQAFAAVLGRGAAPQQGQQPGLLQPGQQAAASRPRQSLQAATAAGAGPPAFTRMPSYALPVPPLVPLPATATAAAAAAWDARQAVPPPAAGSSLPQSAAVRPRPSSKPTAQLRPSPTTMAAADTAAAATAAAAAEAANARAAATVTTAKAATSCVPAVSPVPKRTSSPAGGDRQLPHQVQLQQAHHEQQQQQQQQQDDGATFEDVHMLLASLNLPGMSSNGIGSGAADQLGRDAAGGGTTLRAAAGGSATVPQGPAQAATPAAGREAWSACRAGGGGGGGGFPGAALVSAGLDAPGSEALSADAGGPGAYSGAALDTVRWPFEQALAARSPGGPRGPGGGGADTEGFSRALGPACRAWLRSVGKVATQQQGQQQGAGAELQELVLQLREAALERRHVEAFLMGTRLRLARPRLARLQALAAASGAPPAVTTALLAQLEDRLRLKLCLGALRRHAAAGARLADLLQSRHEAGGPLVVAAWQCWRRAAAGRMELRSRVEAMGAARRRLNTVRVMFAWRAAAQRAAQLRQLGACLRQRVARRVAAECLHAWRAACQRGLALGRAHRTLVAARTRRHLLAWRDASRRLAISGQQHARAGRHHRSRLLLAALAHWRFLHVSRAVARVWESALARRRGLQLLARALRVWHFYARRCRQLIRQLAGQRAAEASGAMPLVDESELPAPLALAAVPALMQRLLAAARTFMLAMSDELLHLRTFLRFSHPTSMTRATPLPAEGPAPGHGAAAAGAAAGGNPAAAEGARGKGGREGVPRGGREAGGSPVLLISGQWRHKRQVLVLLAQLRRVERLAADVEAQLEAAERDGRMVRLGLQAQADDIQRRTAVSRDEMAAARAQQRALQADLEQLNRAAAAAVCPPPADSQEAEAVGGYLERCRAASAAAAEQLRGAEAQLVEAQASHAHAQGATAEAQERAASLRRVQLERQAAAEEAARLPPHPAFARAQEAERQGRERLLAAQRRLSEALQLKGALMGHWRETQLAAASAPRYAAQRHALRVGEAQQQVVEAAKVVSLAELEVQDLLRAVDRLTQSTQEARAQDDQLRAAADAAAAAAAEAAARAADAAREAAAAAAAEQRAGAAVAGLALEVHRLREAELPQTPTQQQAVLLEPLRGREEAARGEVEVCRERAEAAHRELQAALAAAAELSHQVEAAEVSYRAQLLRLQPGRARLHQSAAQLRSRLTAFPSELVRQLRRVVEENGIEASQDANGEWTVGNLPPEWAPDLRPGRLMLADVASDEECVLAGEGKGEGAGDRHDIGATPVSLQGLMGLSLRGRPPASRQQRRGGSPLRAAAAPCSPSSQMSISDATSTTSFGHALPGNGPAAAASAATAAAAAAVAAVATTRTGVSGAVVALDGPHRGRDAGAAAAAAAVAATQPPMRRPPQDTATLLPHYPHPHHHPHHQHLLGLPMDLHSMSAAQLSRLARSVLGLAANRSANRLEASSGGSPRRGDGFAAAITGGAGFDPGSAADADGSGGGGGVGDSLRRQGVQRPGVKRRASPRVDRRRSGWGWGSRDETFAMGGRERAWGLQGDAPGQQPAVGGGGAAVRSPTWTASPPTRAAPGRLDAAGLPGAWAEGEQAGGGGGGGGSHSSSSSSPVAPRGAAVSPETRRLISLLERALGVELPAGDEARMRTAGEPDLSGVEAAPLDADHRPLPLHPGQLHARAREVAQGSQRPPAALPAPDGRPPLAQWELGREELPIRMPAAWEGCAAVGTRAPTRAAGEADGRRQPGGAVAAAQPLLLPLPPAGPDLAGPASGKPAAASAGAEERVDGRFSSASSIYAQQFSNPSHFPWALADQGSSSDDATALAVAQRKGWCPDGERPPPPPPAQADLQRHQPQSAHQQQQPAQRLPQQQVQLPEEQQRLRQRGQPALGKPSADVAAHLSDSTVAPRRAAHLDRGAPSAAAAGSSSPGPAAGAGSPRANGAPPALQRLDDAACLFYRRRLCHRTLQGFRQYAANLACLLARLGSVAGAARLQWAVSHWRSRVREPQALAEGAARAGACQRCLRRWRSYVCERRRRALLLGLGRQLSRQRLLRACLQGWRLWCDRKARNRRAAASAHRHRLRGWLLRWRRGARTARVRRAHKAAARNHYVQAACRRCLEHWLRTARAQRLLCRVFARAELLWEEHQGPSTHFGEEFDALRHAFDRLRRYRAHRLAKRSERINEQAALVFRASLLRVRVFAAWQRAVASTWHERYVRRLAARLLRTWRRLAHQQRELPRSLCNLRRRLRARGYTAGESDVRRRWLLRSVLAAFAATWHDSWRHYTRSLLSRALRSWLMPLAEALVLVQAHRCRRQRLLLLRWRAVAAWWSNLRRTCIALMARRNRRLARASLAAWAQFVLGAREKGDLTSAARFHYERSVALRVLRRLSDCARQAWSAAVAHDASRRLRRCVAQWRAQALSTRAKTEALKRTLVSVDASMQELHQQQDCEPAGQCGQDQDQAPSIVTGALLPSWPQPARHRADCTVTAAPVKPAAREQQPPTPVPTEASGDGSSDGRYRMVEVEVPGGRLAQVLVLEPRPEDSGCALGGPIPGSPDEAFWHAGTTEVRRQDLGELEHDASRSTSGQGRERNNGASPPSYIALHDLPSDVSSMDRPTLQMWRRYAEKQLADEWRRRQLLRRTMSGWRRAIAKASYIKRWKQRKGTANHPGPRGQRG
ncbi:hypothetical protein PLESTM_000221700 [Pleodorina starrii]|nr:hypothetical protein PLESTM_000221700 [Pleodorina starrii]